MKQGLVAGTGCTVPVIGQGTWGLGEVHGDRAREVQALRLGIALGMTLIDTAEYYGAGRAEAVVGEAVADCRDRVFLVTKVWPSHAGYREVLQSVAGSLRRMRTDRVDAVLLHWPTRSVPLTTTLRAFAELQARGVVGCFGVSNFDLPRWRAAEAASPPGTGPVFNQVCYHLANRRVENAILPHAQTHGQGLLAWAPLGHGRLSAWRGYPVLAAEADRLGVTPHQLALAFLVTRPGVVAIPKATTTEHVRANAAAGDLELGPDAVTRLEAAFPRGPHTRFPILPPHAPVFRLLLAAERARARGFPPRRRPPTHPPA